MKKKLLALVMVGVMALGMLAGCGKKSEETEPDLKEIKIALSFGDSGTIWRKQLSYNLSNLFGPEVNAEFVYQEAKFDADGIVSFVESEIAAGVDGLFFCPTTDAILPTICSLCEEAEVYWAISMRTINDSEIKAMCEASPYYVGNCYEDEENTGYIVGEYLGSQNAKKVALITTVKGDTTGDAREIGFARACEEYGIEVVGEARGLAQASDVTNAVESFLSANADLDVVFCVGTTVPGVQGVAVKAIQDAGRDEVKVVCIDHPDEIQELFESGILTYSVGVPSFGIDLYMCAVKVANAIQGYPIDGEAEGRSSNFIGMAIVSSAEEAKNYAEASSDEEYVFFDETEIAQMLGWKNADLSEETLQKILDEYTL